MRGAALRSGSLLHRVEEALRPRHRGVGAQSNGPIVHVEAPKALGRAMQSV